ncbi:hypothetical protein PRK78_002184 [Emydomyces testavorans]|uniref:FAS1 domain-containing protein n=1 Tax=Emydomyces testavorans TaxID=2070801 RepID=A0AAF0DF81_9EURO|nr:hypothetical protein PRK78_002184 [Emydomyces testavorans]
MKTVLLFSAAYIAAGVVIPDQNPMKPLIESSSSTPSTVSQSVSSDSELEADFVFSTSYAEEISNNVESMTAWALNLPHLPRPLRSEEETDMKNCDDESYKNGLDLNYPGHHDKPNKTTYQLITSGEETSIFAKLVSQFDDIVDLLNSTDESHTVLVPRDKALEKAIHFHPPKEYVKKFVLYHILKKPATARTIFHSRTICTLLKQDELGDYDQRISTQFGVTGLTINYIARIAKANLCAKNGIVHILDHLLLPPLQSSDTLSLVPSVFSTLDFGLLKTGLYEKINDTSTHTGSTIFAPSNLAFRKLGPMVNAFLFSRWGEKYLRALLRYHIVFDHTLYSDAYHRPKKEEDSSKTIHVDLPTLLDDRHLSIDIASFDRFATMKINGFITVASSDVIARDGVIHVLNDVLIPPKQPQDGNDHYNPLKEDGDEFAVPTVEDMIERLGPFVQKD